jgi:hypothetical protein
LRELIRLLLEASQQPPAARPDAGAILGEISLAGGAQGLPILSGGGEGCGEHERGEDDAGHDLRSFLIMKWQARP